MGVTPVGRVDQVIKKGMAPEERGGQVQHMGMSHVGKRGYYNNYAIINFKNNATVLTHLSSSRPFSCLNNKNSEQR